LNPTCKIYGRYSKTPTLLEKPCAKQKSICAIS